MIKELYSILLSICNNDLLYYILIGSIILNIFINILIIL